ncbi:hypothetical protein EV693_10430 [Nicoletella semolina]|uniref:Uncharacterized protein n=1 Tax=Nicoletella semolina TaxID=271160 RepID=A0A4R2N9S5_9PAST|nr:hypothetical protein [Nicoletella semolina]MDH2925324.1 hypothetical protein [Nicoletella semolina]TCP17801.1 hypothetical protein EV693_10430 [Nicoletella semolina]
MIREINLGNIKFIDVQEFIKVKKEIYDKFLEEKEKIISQCLESDFNLFLYKKLMKEIINIKKLIIHDTATFINQYFNYKLVILLNGSYARNMIRFNSDLDLTVLSNFNTRYEVYQFEELLYCIVLYFVKYF